MTYSKIYVPSVSDNAKDEIKVFHAASPSQYQSGSMREITSEKFHRPEIVISEKSGSHNYSDTYRHKRSYSRRTFLPSAGSVLAVAALCLASFIIGCSVTDNALSNAIIGIAAATYGKVPEQGEEVHTSYENDTSTFYNKYMQSENISSAEISLDYLAANPYSTQKNGDLQNNSSNYPVNSAAEIPVKSTSGGKIGADGEILYPVLSKDLSSSDIHSLSNQTSYKPDTFQLLSRTPSALKALSVTPSEPLVLILHTHGTESYNTCPKDGYYSSALPVRSENSIENVVGIGEKIASVLGNFGIPVIHSTKMCDKDSFVRAYTTSANEARAYLDKYPSIRFIIDLHRDSIEAADKTKTKPVFSVAGQNTAQLMFVVGTDAAGAKHPNWKENLSLALTLQSEISSDFNGLFRRINLRTASFNQQLSDGYLLLECGSCANTYAEAEAAAEMFATGFARVIKKYSA